MSIVLQVDVSSTTSAPQSKMTPVKDPALRFPTAQKWNASTFDVISNEHFTPRRELCGVETPTRKTTPISVSVTPERCAVSSSVDYNVVAPVGSGSQGRRLRAASAPRGTLNLTDEPMLADEKPTFRQHAQRRHLRRRDSDVLCQAGSAVEERSQSRLKQRRPNHLRTHSDVPVAAGGPLVDERASPLNVKQNEKRAPGPCGGYGFPSSVTYNILSLVEHSEPTSVPHVGTVVLRSNSS